MPSKEHAWFGTGRSGLLFVEDDSGAASVIQIRNIVAVQTSGTWNESELMRHVLMTIFMVMKERTVPAGEFKAKCLQILDEVNRSRKPVTVTKRGKPVARIVSVSQKKCAFGSMAGTVLTEIDIVSPVDEPWDAER